LFELSFPLSNILGACCLSNKQNHSFLLSSTAFHRTPLPEIPTPPLADLRTSLLYACARIAIRRSQVLPFPSDSLLVFSGQLSFPRITIILMDDTGAFLANQSQIRSEISSPACSFFPPLWKIDPAIFLVFFCAGSCSIPPSRIFTMFFTLATFPRSPPFFAVWRNFPCVHFKVRFVDFLFFSHHPFLFTLVPLLSSSTCHFLRCPPWI